jgi:hypothetical protein
MSPDMAIAYMEYTKDISRFFASELPYLFPKRSEDAQGINNQIFLHLLKGIGDNGYQWQGQSVLQLTISCQGVVGNDTFVKGSCYRQRILRQKEQGSEKKKQGE